MNKLLLNLLTIPLFLLLAVGVFAQQRTDEQKQTILPRNETIDDVYFAANDTVIVSGTVNGDAYVAGGTVTVDGTINGDLLVAGGTVTVRGTVRNDIRAAGGTVVISSPVGGSISAVGGTVLISESAQVGRSLVGAGGTYEVQAPVNGSIAVGAGQLTLGNAVNGNVRTGVGQLTLTDGAQVNGSIEYWSEKKAIIAPEASVSGRTTQHMPPRTDEAEAAAKGVAQGISFGATLAGFVTTLVLGLLLLYFAPRYMDAASGLIHTSLGKTLLVGFLTLIVVPILIILLFVTLIGIPLGILVLLMFIIMFFFAKVLAVAAIGRQVVTWGKWKLQRGWILLIGLVVYTVISMIPVIGWIFAMLAYFAGFGALVLAKRNYYDDFKRKKLI